MHTRQEGKPTQELKHCTGQGAVEWKHFGPYDATWEMEDAMRHAYPFLFTYVYTEHVDK
jgi:hypothetical protein